MGKIEALEETKKSLERVQELDLDGLPRKEELGASLNFEGAIEPAKKVVSVFKKLTISALNDFPEADLNKIKQKCDGFYNITEDIREFEVSDHNNPTQIRDSYIESLKNSYDGTFNVLRPYISYSLHRAVDFQQLDLDARAIFQEIKDKASNIQSELDEKKEEASGILEEIRGVAAEQGVTQQAIHFKKESEHHEDEADKWQTKVIWAAAIIGVYAVATLFIHKWEWLTPQDTFETAQLIVSKILIFAVLSYLLVLSAKNYLNHKHNAIINKHRQNALVTYKALVDAAGDEAAKEAVLIHAASCIFNPQSTGYSSQSDSSGGSRSFIEILSKPASQPSSSE